MANSFFKFQQFTVRQELCAMKVGTDGTLLGAWANGGRSVLDIGTGTGLIALMMAQRFPEARVTAIDIDQAACLQAHDNVAASPFARRISVVHASLQHFCDETQHHSENQANDVYTQFDSIVCNPPFFVNSLKAPNEQRSMARHADSLTYAQLFSGVSQLLADGGEFSAIVPFDCREAFVSEAFLHGLFQSRICAVRTTPHKPPRRYLQAFRKSAVAHIEQTVGIIEDAPGQKSSWYRQLTGSFYL